MADGICIVDLTQSRNPRRTFIKAMALALAFALFMSLLDIYLLDEYWYCYMRQQGRGAWLFGYECRPNYPPPIVKFGVSSTHQFNAP